MTYSVLLVEDALDLAHIVQQELETAGYTVTLVNSAEAALTVCQQSAFQLVILDWMLPGRDGLAFLRELRTFSTVPVLMLTARDSELDRVWGLEVGADDYLTKPFSLRELIARVHALLRRRELIEQTLRADQQNALSVIEHGNLRLDPQAHAAWLNSEPLELTRTEFALLRLLVSNPQRVFSRAYLLDTVWGAEYVDGDRAVDNAILRLRKKLKESAVALETVWGVGYRWQPL
jgi:two-component system phosphate regulon response regulator PhoB